jgi:hypothetical protein
MEFLLEKAKQEKQAIVIAAALTLFDHMLPMHPSICHRKAVSDQID